MRSQIVNTAKYAGTSVTLGTAITEILVHFVPSLKDINTAIAAIVIFVVNLALVYTGVISDTQ